MHGWNYKGKLIHPLDAYSSSEHWYSDFLWKCPEQAEKIKDYNHMNGWGDGQAMNSWIKVIVKFLDNNNFQVVKEN